MDSHRVDGGRLRVTRGFDACGSVARASRNPDGEQHRGDDEQSREAAKGGVGNRSHDLLFSVFALIVAGSRAGTLQLARRAYIGMNAARI